MVPLPHLARASRLVQGIQGRVIEPTLVKWPLIALIFFSSPASAETYNLFATNEGSGFPYCAACGHDPIELSAC